MVGLVSGDLCNGGGGVGKGNSSSCPIYERQDLKDTPIECTNNSVHQIAIGISQLAAATCRGAKCASRRGKKQNLRQSRHVILTMRHREGVDSLLPFYCGSKQDDCYHGDYQWAIVYL